jgi:transposase
MLRENRNKIKVFFIPLYIPELNSQEYVNQDVKTNVINKKRPINKSPLHTNVEDFKYTGEKDS